MGHLFPDGDIHVGDVAEKVDNAATGGGQLGFGIENGHQETESREREKDVSHKATIFCEREKGNQSRGKD